MLQTVNKAGQVLDLFTVEHPEWGVTEAAKTLELPKSGTHALMTSLASMGLLRRTSTGRYRLGWRVMTINQILLETTNFRQEARRAMEHLVDRYGELTHLAALENGQVIYIDKIQGTRAVQVAITGTGMTLPGHGSGVGKVLLAHQPREKVLQMLDEQGMSTLTPNTITSLDDFLKELETVRKQGYALDLEETVRDLRCVAAPIKDHTGEVVAAMSFSIPAYRFEQGGERYRMAIVETAREVSRNLGHFDQRRREC